MKKVMLVVMIVIAFAMAGCSNDISSAEKNEEVTSAVENNNIVVEDSNGREVVFTKKPEKVISLYASFADLWYEAGGDLVGICDSRRLPEKAENLPKVGKMSTPNIEAILALEPDLMIMRSAYAKQEELLSIFEENNINVVFVNYNSFEEMMKVYEMFCLINENENIFEEKGISMRTKISEIIKLQSEFTYLQLFATSKSVSAKDKNITSEIINDFGGINITTEYSISNEESRQFSLEKVLELNPTFIFVQTMGSLEKAEERMEKDIISNPAWNSLTAVKEGRFIYLPNDLFVYKPNLRFVEAYEYIDKIIETIR